MLISIYTAYYMSSIQIHSENELFTKIVCSASSNGISHMKTYCSVLLSYKILFCLLQFATLLKVRAFKPLVSMFQAFITYTYCSEVNLVFW
jgi:hypothetical protein